MKKWTSLAFLLCLAAITYGEVKLPAIFGDNMVIQQKSKVAVWGWADAGEKVEVEGSWMWFGTSVKADKDGKWRVKIDTPSADGKPLTLTIKGSNTITLSNVLAGEVWVCSGQSNMEFTFAMLRLGDAIKDENNDNIRLFTVQKKISAVPLDDCAGTWELTRPGALMNFSAVAYYFGKELYSNLNVPIGLINTSWGGTPARS
jgi:sialate O-acetylesterase